MKQIIIDCTHCWALHRLNCQVHAAIRREVFALYSLPGTANRRIDQNLLAAFSSTSAWLLHVRRQLASY